MRMNESPPSSDEESGSGSESESDPNGSRSKAADLRAFIKTNLQMDVTLTRPLKKDQKAYDLSKTKCGEKNEKEGGPLIKSYCARINLRKLKIKQEPDQENYFLRIPEDLLLFKLKKMDHFGPGDRQVTLGCYAKWLYVLLLLLKCQPSLESVVVTNSNKPWTLVLKDKLLAALRNSVSPRGSFPSDTTPMENKSCVMSELHLPISGYLMKVVNFVIEDVKFSSHFDSCSECATCRNECLEYVPDDAMTWEFVGDKKIISETVHQILDKSR